MLIIISIYIMLSRNLFSAVMSTTIFSLICALVFLLLDGVDVSLTEAAVGAGISTILFLSCLRHMDFITKKNTKPIFLHLTLFLFLVITLSYIISDLPEFGKAQANNSYVTNYYLKNTDREIGIPNVVTSVLASYRGFDTLGEVVVIFIAGISVIGILREEYKE